jgi:hypothetical protein
MSVYVEECGARAKFVCADFEAALDDDARVV